MVFLPLGRQWFVVALALVTTIALVRGAWLRSRSAIRWINQGSMARQATGRWAPG